MSATCSNTKLRQNGCSVLRSTNGAHSQVCFICRDTLFVLQQWSAGLYHARSSCHPQYGVFQQLTFRAILR